MGDQGFEKAKTQVFCLHPELDLIEVDYFNVVVDEFLLEEIDPKVDQSPNVEHETTHPLEAVERQSDQCG